MLSISIVASVSLSVVKFLFLFLFFLLFFFFGGELNILLVVKLELMVEVKTRIWEFKTAKYFGIIALHIFD